jgi:hypothetical protein
VDILLYDGTNDGKAARSERSGIRKQAYDILSGMKRAGLFVSRQDETVLRYVEARSGKK